MTRFKASQILARMVRRTKGPMWVKEVVLVTFHMWHRYAAVKVIKTIQENYNYILTFRMVL